MIVRECCHELCVFIDIMLSCKNVMQSKVLHRSNNRQTFYTPTDEHSIKAYQATFFGKTCCVYRHDNVGFCERACVLVSFLSIELLLLLSSRFFWFWHLFKYFFFCLGFFRNSNEIIFSNASSYSTNRISVRFKSILKIDIFIDVLG